MCCALMQYWVSLITGLDSHWNVRLECGTGNGMWDWNVGLECGVDITD